MTACQANSAPASRRSSPTRRVAGLFKHLLDRLAAYDTPAGNLLDQGVAIWPNDLATGPPHGVDNLPFVCAGGAAGYLKTGAYVDAREEGAPFYPAPTRP